MKIIIGDKGIIRIQRPFKIELYYNYINNFGQLVHKLKELKDRFSNEHEETSMPSLNFSD